MTHGKGTLQILEENQSVAQHHLSILEFAISAHFVSLLFDRWLVESEKSEKNKLHHQYIISMVCALIDYSSHPIKLRNCLVIVKK